VALADEESFHMRVEMADKVQAKGWLCGPWDSDLNISLGYANKGVDEPHEHRQMTEIYLMARGTATMRVENETIELLQDQVLVIEPGEAHTFLSSSPDHFHFVIQTPGLYGERAQADKVRVPRSRLEPPSPDA
jgi:mannose-6-phosphate isomerase-like protein (cupin superfamily)